MSGTNDDVLIVERRRTDEEMDISLFSVGRFSALLLWLFRRSLEQWIYSRRKPCIHC